MKGYALADTRSMTVEEYIEFEERSEIRHEMINNQLIPDVVVTNDANDLEVSNVYFIKRPSVIFEVISKTSRIEDSADKFIRYKNIESLQNYILVDSEKAWVEVRYKTHEGEWEANAYIISDEKFPVPALGVELKFEDVYEGVRFS